ncbi:MAG TPA: RagB/SusD family nutrient uptake outer membrane protein [Longimicrobiaceae bacterium]|nr:RagB/SusD family nutrient uptake outer membrane protein [Longimicrobiaceae bacterium]
MKILRVLALVAGLGAVLAGCDDAFLTTVPQDRISDETYWQTPKDFEAALNAGYRNLVTLDQMYIDGATDIGYSQQYWMRESPYARGEQNAQTGWGHDLWVNLYQGVAKVNDVLAHLKTQTTLTQEQATQLEAEARFLRGYYYHELLWLYGGVPLLTTVPSPDSALTIPRASHDEVLDLVLSDLTFAGENLPKVRYQPSDANYGRATAGAALAYKARAALYAASLAKYADGDQEKANQLFATARDAAKAVMDLGVYSLYPDYRKLFTNAGEGNEEVIFDYQVVKGQNGWWAWKGFAPHSMGGNVDMTPTRALVDAFDMANGKPITDPTSGYDPSPPVIEYDAAGNPTVVSLGMYANRDPRLYATVLFPGAQFNGTVYNSFPDSPTADRLDPSNFYNTHTGYMALKYVDPVDQFDVWNSGINTIKMRYAGVLLMYAEAMIELGDWADPSVADALNQIRDRVDMPHVSLTSQQEAIDVVRHERVVELAWEGLRLADLRRWRIAEDVLPGKVYGIDYRDENGNVVTAESADTRKFEAPRDYLWPIPQTERDLNPDLEQNPGY